MNINNSDSIKNFYETEYSRSSGITQVPEYDNFLYYPILKLLSPHLKKGMHVLDLGCNTGNISFYMANKGCQVTGIDLAQNAIEDARQSAIHHGIQNVDFYALDFLKEWQKPEAFDLVFCCHVVEHTPDDTSFIRKIAFSVKQGGLLILIAPSKYSWYYRINMLIHGKCDYDTAVGHLRRYKTSDLKHLSQMNGFDIQSVNFFDSILRDTFILPKSMRIFNRIWARKYIRTFFNTIDTFLAQFIFPGAICICGKKQL
jgi:SAM-dependent methyltransferase